MTADIPRHATEELVAFVVAARDDWAERDVRGVMAHAAANGVTWEAAVVKLAKLVVNPKSRLAELVPDSRDPLRHPGTPASVEAKDALLDEYVRSADWYRRAHGAEGGDAA